MIASKDPKWAGLIYINKMEGNTYPMNMKNKMAAVISAPRLAGDNIPNMANTKQGGEKLMKTT